MSRAEANRIVTTLNKAYQSDLGKPPRGKTYHEAYDGGTGRPLDETRALYEKMRAEIGALGIAFR